MERELKTKFGKNFNKFSWNFNIYYIGVKLYMLNYKIKLVFLFLSFFRDVDILFVFISFTTHFTDVVRDRSEWR